MEKSKNIIIIILSIIVLGLVGFIIYDKVINNETINNNLNENSNNVTDDQNEEKDSSKASLTLDLKNACINPVDYLGSDIYYDYHLNGFDITFNNILLNNTYHKLSYVRDIKNRFWSLYLNEKFVMKKELEDKILTKVCNYNNYIIISHNWEGLDSNHIINANGELDFEFVGDYDYKDNKLEVYSYEYEYETPTLVTFTIDLTTNFLKKSNIVREEFNCEDIDPSDENSLTDKKLGYKTQFCYGP